MIYQKKFFKNNIKIEIQFTFFLLYKKMETKNIYYTAQKLID